MCLLWIQSFITKRMAYVSRLAVAKERWLLTLVECGGAVYVSWDEGGLWLLPHSVVPHPPDAALGWEKRQPLIRTQHGATFIEGFFAPKGWVAMRVCASNLHLYTKKKSSSFTAWWHVCVQVQQSPSRAIDPTKNGYTESLTVCNLRDRPWAAFFFLFSSDAKSRSICQIPRGALKIALTKTRKKILPHACIWGFFCFYNFQIGSTCGHDNTHMKEALAFSGF